MKNLLGNKRAISNDSKAENKSEYRVNVTDFMKKDRETIFNALADGKGRLDIRPGLVTLIFFNLNDKKKFYEIL